ncbi:hypothetical protein ACJ5H2_04755 [Nocardioides sp. R1-1]|uniref:hypothetical protein n=1 Tax=Nocardioides sp. R1-1 TaxID=3383502 RepID=UPI0038D1E773
MRLHERAPLLVPAALLLAFGPSGCTAGGGGSHPAVEEVVSAADGLVEGELHEIATALRLGGPVGSRSFSLCGESYAPGGVRLRTVVRFDSSDTVSPREGRAAAAAVLEAAGWSVDRDGEPAPGERVVVLTATKDRLVLRVELAWGVVQVGLRSTCVETPDDVARTYDDRPATAVEWSS